VEVIDVASGREVTGGFALPQPITRRGQIRPDGRYMAVQTEVGRNEIWEVIEGRVRVIALEDAPKGNAWSQFSAVGDLVSMVEGRSPIIRAWNLRTGRLVAPPLHCDVTIFHFSPGFSPDGKRLAAGGIDGGIARVWDAATGQALFDLKPMDATQVNRVAFSPDGTRIATTNNLYEARLWNGMTGAPISPILLHRARVEAATFSPDGRTFATTSHDGLARVWDARDGTPISETLALPGRVLNVQYSADGSRIATYSADGTARIWDTPTGSPLSDALLHTLPIEFPELVQSANGQFSPVDGRFLCTFSPTHIYLWPVPPDAGNAPVPEWLLRLATICAGKRVTPDGVLVDASDEIAMFDELRREIAALPAEAPFAEWGRWFLADPATRSIAPGFTITPAEADKLAGR
jgi:WD40 repeat protein